MVNSNRDRISYRLHVCDLFSRILKNAIFATAL